MTVAALTPSIEYLEDGVTLSFAAPFRFLSGTLLVERILPTGAISILTPGSQYATAGGDTDAGGTVILMATIAGSRLRIQRATPRRQQADYTTNDTFPAESHEQALDRQMLIAQEQDVAVGDVTGRALMVPHGETVQEIPPVAARAGMFLAFGPGGVPVPAEGTGADAALRADLASGDPGRGGALAAFRLNHPNAVTRDLVKKAMERGISVKDLGAKADGSDDTDFIEWADEVAAALGMVLRFPNGIYRTSRTLNATASWHGDNAFLKFLNNVSPGLIATQSVASVRTPGTVIGGMTFDGNRANQSWEWQGSANYGLAVQAGGVTVINCTTCNVTGNGTGIPTKLGAGRIAFLNHRSFGNGKKGFHSGQVSGFDIIGGEWFENEHDSGIGAHQGASDFKIISPTCHNNGHAGIHAGHSLAGPGSQSHDIIISDVLTYGNFTCGILVGASQAATHADRIFNVQINGGIVRDKIVIQAATNVFITGTDLQGSNIEADCYKSLVIDGVKMLHPGTGVRIRCRWVAFGADTETTSEGVHILNPQINTTGATSGIVVSGTASGKVINPTYIGADPSSYHCHISNNQRDIVVKSDSPVRLGGTTFAAVNDNGPQRTVYAAAAPTSGDWRVGDRVLRTALSVDGNGNVRIGELCTVAGSPGTWVPQFMPTASTA